VEKENHLKTGQDTPATPPVPPIANSSALPLKSLIALPVLTSKIFITTLWKKKSTLVPAPWRSKLTTPQGEKKKREKTHISITRIAWFMAAVGYQIFLTRGKINEFNLQMISSEWVLLNRKTKFQVKLQERNVKKNLRMSITH
jgi:hypothetical protein